MPASAGDVRRVAICGAGFIGRNLIAHLLDSGVEISVLDHKPCPPELEGRVRWHRGDFTDQDLLRAVLAGADVAYHLVSTTVPGDDHVGMIPELADNIFATIRFIDTCIAIGVRRIVFVSSSSVYGLQEHTPIPETAATNPISSHGIQKLTIEKYLLLYRFDHDIDVRIIRLSNPFGPGQALHGRQGFVAIAIGKVMAGEPILLRAGGAPIRDFIYIDDVSRALALAGIAPSVPPVMNLGTGEGHSLADVVAALGALLGRPLATTEGPLRKADIPTSVLDAGLIRRSVGFAPTTSLHDGLELTLRHWGVIP
jgi:UDP-glucose 4-epimerase